MREMLKAAAAVALVAMATTAASAGTYTVKAGDTLVGIARERLGDAARWREIADANGIRDPRRLRIGTVLAIPADLARTATPSPAQVPLATAPSTRRQPEGDRPAVLPPAASHAAEENPTATPQAAQEPIATARETRRAYRPRRSYELMPSRTQDRTSGGPTAYPAEEQGPIVRRRARRIAGDEPLATARDTRRAYRSGADLMPERRSEIPAGGATAYPGPAVENPGHGHRARARFRATAPGYTSYPQVAQEPIGILRRVRGMRVAGPSDYPTTYPRRDRDAVIADGKILRRLDAPNW